ncbi:hypothetical protein D9M68_343160 [compost metagenome]
MWSCGSADVSRSGTTLDEVSQRFSVALAGWSRSIQQCPGLLPLSGVEPFREGLIQAGQHLPRNFRIVLVLPQPSQTQRRAQL